MLEEAKRTLSAAVGPFNPIQSHSIPFNPIQSHSIPFNPIQSQTHCSPNRKGCGSVTLPCTLGPVHLLPSCPLPSPSSAPASALAKQAPLGLQCSRSPSWLLIIWSTWGICMASYRWGFQMPSKNQVVDLWASIISVERCHRHVFVLFC